MVETDKQARDADADSLLTKTDADVYRRAAVREHMRPDDEPALDRLRTHHLIEDDPHSPSVPIVLDPRTARRQAVEEAHDRISDMLRELREQALIYDGLTDVYAQQRPTDGGVRLLDDPNLANAAIGQSMSRLSTALYTAQPVQRTPQVLAASMQRDGDLLRRGIRMYTIYPTSARSRPLESQWAEEMSALGAEIRTSPIPFPRIIVVDGVAAYVEEPKADEASDGQGPGAAIEITHPPLMAWVRSIYMHYWQLSQPWQGGRARKADGATLTTHRERAILRLLENELPRQRIARQLFVAERTIRTDLAALREKFGVETDFALALRWRAHPEYDLP
jgi:DNA-binding CsgD family transcriptional regulator